MRKESFTCEDRQVSFYSGAFSTSPLVVLNTYSGDGASVYKAMQEIRASDCNLLVVGKLAWDHDMTPWYCPPLGPGDSPCTGGADDYLPVLVDVIIPTTCEKFSLTPSYMALAGYSLAGLFALYAAYRCSTFSRLASVSGSLWFPDFADYVTSHELARVPERIYLSLGGKEAKTKNPYLSCVQEKTEKLCAHFQELGIDTRFELNPGNHFKDPALRTAKGIKAILD